MAHAILDELFIANDGNPAWHGLGKIRKMAQSFGEALDELLNGATYTLEPMATYNLDQGRFELLPETKNVVFRRPGHPAKSFGMVSNSFRILTPDRIKDMIDPIVAEAGYTVATAGVLRGGSSIFIALYTGERDIVGEPHKDYLTFDLSWEPGRVAQVYSTTVRTVCANTQAIGIAQSSLNMEVSHTGDVHGKLALATEFVANYEDRKRFFADLMEAFVSYEVNKEETEHAIMAALPMPQTPKVLSKTVQQLSPAELARIKKIGGPAAEFIDSLTGKERAFVNSVARTEQARELVREAIEGFHKDFPEFKGTAYAVYNGITQTADWRPGKGDIAADVVSGPRWREKIRGAQFLTSLAMPGA